MEMITDSAWMIPSIIVATLAVPGLVFKTGEWIGSVNSYGKDFEKVMQAVRSDLADISNGLKEILAGLPVALLVAGGPLRLSDTGREISKTLSASEWASETASLIAGQVEGKTPYKIQEFCFHYVSKELGPSAELDIHLKECACELGIKKEQTLKVLAIELRDVLTGTAK